MTCHHPSVARPTPDFEWCTECGAYRIFSTWNLPRSALPTEPEPEPWSASSALERLRKRELEAAATVRPRRATPVTALVDTYCSQCDALMTGPANWLTLQCPDCGHVNARC